MLTHWKTLSVLFLALPMAIAGCDAVTGEDDSSSSSSSSSDGAFSILGVSGDAVAMHGTSWYFCYTNVEEAPVVDEAELWSISGDKFTIRYFRYDNSPDASCSGTEEEASFHYTISNVTTNGTKTLVGWTDGTAFPATNPTTGSDTPEVTLLVGDVAASDGSDSFDDAPFFRLIDDTVDPMILYHDHEPDSTNDGMDVQTNCGSDANGYPDCVSTVDSLEEQ